jgi:hypothetical protein
MVSQARGSIFRRTDGKYFIYLPTKLVEDTGFPLPIRDKATKVLIRFKRGEKKLTIEKELARTLRTSKFE